MWRVVFSSLLLSLKFYRILDWFKVLGLVLISCMLFEASFHDFIKLLIISSLVIAYGFSVNDLFDFKYRKEKNLVGLLYSKKKHIVIILVSMPLILSLLLAHIFLPLRSRLFLFLSLLILSLYSIPPVRLRDRKIFDVLCNSAFCLAFVYSYFYFTSHVDLHFFFFLSVFLFFFFISEITHELSHKRKDIASGKISTAVWLGREKSIRIVKLVIFINIFLSSTFLLFIQSSLIALPLISILFSILRLERINCWKKHFRN